MTDSDLDDLDGFAEPEETEIDIFTLEDFHSDSAELPEPVISIHDLEYDLQADDVLVGPLKELRNIIEVIFTEKRALNRCEVVYLPSLEDFSIEEIIKTDIPGEADFAYIFGKNSLCYFNRKEKKTESIFVNPDNLAEQSQLDYLKSVFHLEGLKPIVKILTPHKQHTITGVTQHAHNDIYVPPIQDALIKYGWFLLLALNLSDEAKKTSQRACLKSIFNAYATSIAQEDGAGNQALHNLAWLFAVWGHSTQYWFNPKLKPLADKYKSPAVSIANDEAICLNFARVLLSYIVKKIEEQKEELGRIDYSKEEYYRACEEYNRAVGLDFFKIPKARAGSHRASSSYSQPPVP